MSAAPDPAAVAGGPERLPAPVRILADDLTGALDTAAMFARDGPVPVRLDSPAPDDDAAVSVVSTGTRDVPVQALASLLAPSIGWLAGAGIAFKKVDSLLRGNVLAEVAEVVRAGGFERVLFAPAFPAQGRLTVGGALQLAAQAVAGAPGSVGPAPSGPGPLADAFVALGLAAAVGDDALAALARGSGPCVLVPDARTDADLERLVALALSGPGRLLWCGSAGLAQALMRHAGRAPGMARSPGVGASPVLTVPGASPVLTVPGAFPALLIPGAAPVLPIPGAAPALPIPGASPASPIPGAAPALPIPGAAPASRPTTRSDAAAGPNGSPDPARPALLVTATRHPVLRGQLARLRDDPVAAAWTLEDLADTEPLDAARAALRLAAGAARVVAAHPRPACVVVVGGDTLLALCRACGADRLSAAPAPRPGWGAAVFGSGAWAGVRCLTRSGAFGAPDDLTALLRAAPPIELPEHR